MGYVETLVQRGLDFVDEKGVAAYVEKARTVSTIDSALGLVSTRGPELVKTLDQTLDQTLEGVQVRKTKLLGTVTAKTTMIVGTVNDTTTKVLEQVQDKKTQALAKFDFAKQKQQEYVQLALDTAQEKKQGALASAHQMQQTAAAQKGALLQQLLTRTQGTAAEKAAEYFVLMADKSECLVRKSLQLPLTLKERFDSRSVDETREFILEFGREKIYRPLSTYTNCVAVFVVNGKNQLSAMTAERMLQSRELLLDNVKTAAAFVSQRYAALAQDPRMAQIIVYVAQLQGHGVEGKAMLEKKFAVASTEALALKAKALARTEKLSTTLAQSYGRVLAMFSEQTSCLFVFVQRSHADVAKKVESTKGRVAELTKSLKAKAQ